MYRDDVIIYKYINVVIIKLLYFILCKMEFFRK